MQEALKKVTDTPVESGERSVTLCLQSQKIFLTGFWIWDMNSSSVYCSDAMYFPKDVQAIKGIIHPDDLPKIISSIPLMEEKELPHIDFRIITTLGEVKEIVGQSVSISATNTNETLPGNNEGKKDAQGVQQLKDTLRDELTWHSQFLETLLDNSINRITVFDTNYRFMVWNKSCEEVHGIARDDVIGKTIFEIFPGIENYPLFTDAQKRSVKGEYVHITNVQDGFTGAYLELFYVPLKKESGETYAVLNVMNDVSRYVKSSEELNALNKQLETKNAELEQKNEEITSFAFIASHDMKEPLRKIHTFSDWLMETEKEWLSQQGKTVLEKMKASVQRMEVLIDDILVLTKIHSDRHKEEDVDLDKILNQVKEEMADSIRQTSTVVEAKKLPVIKGNANQVFYLFKNLLSNAIKFQKPGSVPQIIITPEIVKGSEVNLNEQREEYLKLSFADNGFGFDQKYEKKIFQVFQRLHGKQEFEGTGIGLAICKKIMENHEGLINVKSELGKGSVFNCFFPLH